MSNNPIKIRTFKFKCYLYEVRFHKMESTDHGVTCKTNKVIDINTKYSLSSQRETLFHELMHVSFEDSPIFKSKNKVKNMEETVILTASPNLVQMLQDNEWLSEFIIKGNEID